MSRDIGRLRRDTSGQILVLFALMAPALLFAGGAGIDLMRAYQARQILSNVASLACQYASTPALMKLAVPDPTGARRQPDYATTVNAYIAAALVRQKYPWTQTNTPAFTYVLNGAGDVKLASSVPTTLTQLARITQVPVAAAAHCYDSPLDIRPPVTDPNLVVGESFEATPPATADHGSWQAYGIPGRGISATPSSNPGTTPAYVGSNGTKWYATGYCLETDQVGVTSTTVADGQRSVELDCDNGSYSGGNSAISTQVYLAVGNYELRWSYISRVIYPNYHPTYLCGSDARDLAWANDQQVAGSLVANAPRTNQINVYLDRDTTGRAPLHTTLDGQQQLAGANLIDMCVYASDWTERSVRISVKTPTNYWLTFAADGQNDGAGGELDYVRLCVKSCAGSPKDNFPSSWASANPANPKLLFEDTFETPSASEDASPAPSHGIAVAAPMNDAYGMSGTNVGGWPYRLNTGWAVAPVNQLTRGTKHAGASRAYEGGQYVLMDGYNANGNAFTNRLISRSFPLVPGYYQISYAYMSVVDFSSAGVTQTYCTAAPGPGTIFGTTGNLAGTVLDIPGTRSINGSTEIVSLFLANGQLVSTPIGGGAQGSQTSYANPNGTISTTPTVAPDGMNWFAYSPYVPNPIIDICGYAPGYRWQPRSVPVTITKPGLYWLTFSANGSTPDGYGGAVDDVKISALGSPYMINPPTGGVTIPVADPQPGSLIPFDGFSIVADPFVPPAPLQ